MCVVIYVNKRGRQVYCLPCLFSFKIGNLSLKC